MDEIKCSGEALWERIERAVEIVKECLRRITRAQKSANIPSAVIGDNAVQHWVSQADESVVGYKRDVDILLNEPDQCRQLSDCTIAIAESTKSLVPGLKQLRLT